MLGTSKDFLFELLIPNGIENIKDEARNKIVV